MKAISLWQPWASLIACGAKPFETRSFAPPSDLIGQVIAIHAAKKIDPEAAEFAEELLFGQFEPGGFALAEKLEASWGGEAVGDEIMGIFGHAAMPIGCIVCLARLDAAFQLGEPAEGTAFPAISTVRRMVSRPMPGCFTVRRDEFGDYAPGRWVWLLKDIQPLRPPVRMKGRQGFFDLPQGWLTA